MAAVSSTRASLLNVQLVRVLAQLVSASVASAAPYPADLRLPRPATAAGLIEQPERLYERTGPGLSALDFGAVGDGVCTEAADRSWTKCTGRDQSAALQRAIDAAQAQARTLYLPAGVYMVNTTLTIRKPSENASISKPQPYVTAGLRIIGEGMANTIIVAQHSMEAVVAYEGNEVEPDLAGVTSGHSMESLSVSAAKLATHAIYGPAIIWSRWVRVGVFDAANGAGFRLAFGFCLRLIECTVGSNPGASKATITPSVDHIFTR
eukprot:COSAG02_NODE_5996_length_3885_cov_1.818806_2_plen_264_part_00